MSGESVYTAVGILQAFKCRKRDVFAPPLEADIENMQTLLREIKKYDDQGVSVTDKVKLLNSDDHKPKIKARIEKLLDELNMTMSAISDPGYERVMCFHPKEQGGAHVGFFWCFDKVGDPETDKKMIISDLHRGVDGASGIALREFETLLEVGLAKAYLFNTVHVKASAKNDPPTKNSVTQPRRLMSDGAHSHDTLAHPWLETMLKELYPQTALHVAHGLAAVNRRTGEKREMELWVINGMRRPFTLKKKSWGALLTLALAQQEFDYGSISICGLFPNKYIKDGRGRKKWLVSRENGSGNIFRYIKGPSSDVQLHVVNAADGKFLFDAPFERAVHMEHGVPYRDNDLEDPENVAKQQHLLAAFQQAAIWYAQWDDRVHAEIRQDKKSPPRPSIGEPSPENAREYPAWFAKQKLLLENQPELAATMPAMLFSRAALDSADQQEDDVRSEVSDGELSSGDEALDEDDADIAKIVSGNKRLAEATSGAKKPRINAAG